MALDPACEEAAESLWRIAPAARPCEPPPADPAREARVTALLARGGSRAPTRRGSRRALAELALIAPDDPRVVEAAARAARDAAR